MPTNIFPEDGSAGIGTTEPTQGLLDVRTTVADSTHGLTLRIDGGTAARSYLQTDGNADYDWRLVRGAGGLQGLIVAPDGRVGLGIRPTDGQLAVLPGSADADHGITLQMADGTPAQSYLTSDEADDYLWHLTRGGNATGLVLDKDGRVAVGTEKATVGQLELRPGAADATHGIALKMADGTAAQSYLTADGGGDYRWHLTREGDTKGLVLDKDGRVGLGTESPTVGQLELRPGTADATHGIALKMEAGTAAQSYLTSDEADDYLWHLTRGGDTKGLVLDKDGRVAVGTRKATSGQLELRPGTADATHGIALKMADGTAALSYLTGDGDGDYRWHLTRGDDAKGLVLDKDGKVAVGTSSPGAGQLEVRPATADADHGIVLKMADGTAATSYLAGDGAADYNWLMTRGEAGRGLLLDRQGRLAVGTARKPEAVARIDAGGNALDGLQTPSNYALWLNRASDANGGGQGIAFGSTTGDASDVGAAIVYERTGDHQKGKLRLYTKQSGDSGTAPVAALTLGDDGNVEVGGALKIKTWSLEVPDYVFEPSYRLRELDELERHLDSHRHLPEVPSREQLERDGLDLTELAFTLLKKVEELTLYTIRQQKQLDAQQTILEALSTATER